MDRARRLYHQARRRSGLGTSGSVDLNPQRLWQVLFLRGETWSQSSCSGAFVVVLFLICVLADDHFYSHGALGNVS